MKPSSLTTRIVENRRAHFDFALERFFEAGLVLEGWEVKSIRSKHIQIQESYVIIKNEAAWLIGAHITPLSTVSTHIRPECDRTRKLLLHKKELDYLIGSVHRKGYTLVPIDFHWSHNYIKVSIALAVGKKNHDKRRDEKDREWARQKQRLLTRS